MAYEGELVKMNGRWARFQRLAVTEQSKPWDDTVLVAVELDDELQALLNTTTQPLDEYARRGERVQVRLEPEGLRYEAEAVAMH